MIIAGGGGSVAGDLKKPNADVADANLLPIGKDASRTGPGNKEPASLVFQLWFRFWIRRR